MSFLIKYQDPVAKALQKIERRRQMMEIIPPPFNHQPIPASMPGVAVKVSPKPDDVSDLPRFCSKNGNPIAARYRRDMNGKMRYAQTVQVTEDLYYLNYDGASPTSIIIKTEELGVEICPECGSRGLGAIYCPDCRRYLCYFGALRNEFRCFCGHAGRLSPAAQNVRGFDPRRQS